MPSPQAPTPTRDRRIFRGWWMVVVSIVGQSFGLATALVYTFGVFAKPLAAEFKASRGSIALAVSLMDLAVTVSSPIVGRLVDRHGTRKVIVISLLALTACLTGLSLVHPPLWHLYVLYVMAGCLGVATVSVTYARVIANWFDRERGFALGLSSTGLGLGAFLGPSLAQFLIDKGSFRLAYLGLAAPALLIALPTVVFFLKSTPQEVGLLPDGADAPPVVAASKASAGGMTLSETLRTPAFWLLCSIFFLVAASGNGTGSHVAPLLSDQGSSTRSAALAASVFGLASIFGRVGNGYLVDRFFAPRVAAAIFAAAAVGIIILRHSAAGSLAYFAAFLIGLAIGAEADIMPFLISRYFGMRSMAEIYGWAFASYTLGTAVGRYSVAAGFDATGSYRTPMAFALSAMLLATLATFTLGKYRYLART